MVDQRKRSVCPKSWCFSSSFTESRASKVAKKMLYHLMFQKSYELRCFDMSWASQLVRSLFGNRRTPTSTSKCLPCRRAMWSTHSTHQNPQCQPTSTESGWVKGSVQLQSCSTHDPVAKYWTKRYSNIKCTWSLYQQQINLGSWMSMNIINLEACHLIIYYKTFALRLWSLNAVFSIGYSLIWANLNHKTSWSVRIPTIHAQQLQGALLPFWIRLVDTHLKNRLLSSESQTHQNAGKMRRSRWSQPHGKTISATVCSRMLLCNCEFTPGFFEVTWILACQVNPVGMQGCFNSCSMKTKTRWKPTALHGINNEWGSPFGTRAFNPSNFGSSN